MNCPKCHNVARVNGGEKCDGKVYRRRVCKDEKCAFRFRVEVLQDGNELFVNSVGDHASGPKMEGVKQKRKLLDYSAAIAEIRSSAIGTMFIPWRQI